MSPEGSAGRGFTGHAAVTQAWYVERLRARPADVKVPDMLILFLGENNCCRSYMSEAIFNHYTPEGFEAISAGVYPASQLDPRATALLERHDISTAGYFSKTMHELVQMPDVLVTFGSAVDVEKYPLSLRAAAHTHWGDQLKGDLNGRADTVDAVLASIFEVLETRIHALLALAPERMRGHPERLAEVLGDVGILTGARLPAWSPAAQQPAA
jgi:arsenate reductase